MANHIKVTDNFVCVCLSLGGGSCHRFPFRCLTFDETHFTQKRKHAQQETTHLSRMNNSWEIQKVLEESDVRCCRLLLNKDLAYNFVIPVLMGGAEAAKQKEGVKVQVWDVDTKSLHFLIFKIWTTAQSHVFIKTWFYDFVLRRDLKKGDVIGFHWDQANQRFNFSVLNRSN
ncbi:B3 domain-containing protein At2g33720-like [Trifolium pratense]|uniref:B3 domain-containing protein At2g33720-like n=1 Tax=Trifolium pratense TaxID=57577 RepID=UPI001E695DF2|nr:B3 domain-containing protein At2g33720-like [Trifolium pratense]